jgi:hypothetical protein
MTANYSISFRRLKVWARFADSVLIPGGNSMSANSNETKLSVEGSPEAATEAIETASPAAHRRQALSLSLVGGMAAFLAACGKYVTRFDDASGRNKGLGQGPGKIGGGDVTGTTGDVPGTVVPGTVVPGTVGGGGPSTPGICINTSGAVAKTPAQILAVSGGAPIYALYGNNFSALLAIKLKSSAVGDEVAVAVNDVVHILAKKSATESMLLASRRVRSSDMYSNGVGLIFESLSLSAVATTAIEILIVKGAMHYKAELSKTFSNSFMGKPVYHLGELNQDAAKSAITFGLGFGTEGEAPTLAGTSSITNPQSLGAILHGDGTYLAAKSESTWNVNSVVAPSGIAGADRAVANIFGEIITPSGSLFREHQSLVVYVRKNRTVGGVPYDAYLRYFIYIG